MGDLNTINQEIIDRGHAMAAYSGAGKPTDAIFRLQAHGYPKIEGHFNLDGTHIDKAKEHMGGKPTKAAPGIEHDLGTPGIELDLNTINQEIIDRGREMAAY